MFVYMDTITISTKSEAHSALYLGFRSLGRVLILGGSSQLDPVVRITPIHKPSRIIQAIWKG